ncbi:MAG: peptidase M54 [Desulfobacteraceae bacterium]|nr:MAG: peptidase M54 [Desulfobacteraceae bacterium]
MSTRRTILIAPIGEISDWILEAVAFGVNEAFDLDTRILSLFNNIDFAWDPGRKQYHSTQILEALETHAPDDILKVIGITREDLFIPVLTYVYGEAQLGGTAALISISRLVQGLDTGFLQSSYKRIIKEAVHELGHTFNLRHCRDELCMMHYCRSLEDVDKKSSRFCRYCNIMIADAIRDLGV